MNAFARLWDSDVAFTLRQSPVAIAAVLVASILILSAILAHVVAPRYPSDLATINLIDASLPPAWDAEGNSKFWLVTDDQERDIFSAVSFGMQIPLLLGIASVARAVLPRELHSELAFGVLILAIVLSSWGQYARTVRGSTLVEKNKHYIQAARLIGVSPVKNMLQHVMPNMLGPVLVLAIAPIATAISVEATLSLLSVGVPPTTPSLGTLIRIGNELLFSGERWITIFPGLALILLVLSVNPLCDWLRDALNPKLR